jgi:hypothetical protein
MNTSFTLSYMMISLMAGGYVYFVLWASLRREQFRCELRRIRDELFDFMRENNYNFKEPAYLKVRENLNTLLAASNQLSPTVLVVSIVLLVMDLRRKGLPQTTPPLPDGPLGEKIRDSYLALAWKLIEYSFLKGIPGLLINCVVWVLKHAFHLGGRLRACKRRITKRGADYLQGVGAGVRSPLEIIPH